MTTFRLASVLRLRRTLQEQCEVRAASAHRAAVAADDLAARRHDELRLAPLSPADGRTFATGVTARQHRTSSARDAATAATDARAAHRARIDDLVAASMAVSALERLEERALDAARAAERAREMREIDDLVTARFAHRVTHRTEAAR
jgi:hypothetical protein